MFHNGFYCDPNNVLRQGWLPITLIKLAGSASSRTLLNDAGLDSVPCCQMGKTAVNVWLG